MPSPEAEAGPSRPTKTTPAHTKDAKPPRKRKAGGDGKKGKIFLEDKAGLLSLMANVTGSKETVVKSKLDDQRRRNNPREEAAETAAAENVDKQKLRNEKKKKDARALRDAKFALMKEAKEKKQAKKGKSAVGAAKAAEEAGDSKVQPKKKRVGFA